jgi:hypothetical protein
MKIEVSKISTVITFVVILVLSFFSAVVPQVSAAETAQDKTENKSGGGIGIRLIPRRGETLKGYFYYEMNPGQSRDNRIEVTNNSDQPVRIAMYAGDAKNSDSGALTGNLKGEPLESAGSWIGLEKETDLIPPRSNKTYRIDFKIPENTSPGDYLAFVFIQPEDDDEKDPKSGKVDEKEEKKATVALKVVQRFGIVLWARVPGEHTRSVEYSTLTKQFSSGRLFLLFDLINKGNIFIKTEMSWKLLDSQGLTMIEGNPGDTGYLLPGYTNRVSIPLISNRPIARGEYTLQVRMKDNLSDYELDKEFKVTLP